MKRRRTILATRTLDPGCSSCSARLRLRVRETSSGARACSRRSRGGRTVGTATRSGGSSGSRRLLRSGAARPRRTRRRQAAEPALDVAGRSWCLLSGRRRSATSTCSLGTPEKRRRDLGASRRVRARRERSSSPGVPSFVVDQVEALVELGRRDEAVELLDGTRATRVGSSARRRSPTARAAVACSRRASGDLGGRDRCATRRHSPWHAAVEFAARPRPHAACSRRAQRRMKRRREARATLEEALAVFERIGAALWAERARAELRRISGRAATPARSRLPRSASPLSWPRERRTSEVAAALFLSDRTVEGHLAHIFGKLGIRHRTEIAGASATQTQGIAASNTGDSPVSAEPSAP